MHRMARRAAILRSIENRSGNPSLRWAHRQLFGVTTRYIHLSLEKTGKSFTHHLMERRLEKAALLLRDPRSVPRKIAAIAVEGGSQTCPIQSRLPPTLWRHPLGNARSDPVSAGARRRLPSAQR